MKSLISLVALAVCLHKTYAAPIHNIGNGSPYLLNNLAINNLVPVGHSGTLSSSFSNPSTFTANHMPNNYANAILEPIGNTNIVAKPLIQNEVISNVIPNTIASLPNQLANIEVTNVQFTPLLSELMPSLEFGDVTVAGDLPIGGTIKVSGCIPVYGMISVDGALPSTGTAVVADSFGSQMSTCANQCSS